MKSLINILVITMVILLGQSNSSPSRHRRTSNLGALIAKLQNTPFRLSSGMRDFSHGLFSVLEKEDAGNFVYSPYSIHTALSMALIGSPKISQTYRELASALSVKHEHLEDYLYNYLQLLTYYDSLQGRESIKIKVANKAFVDRSLRLKPNYVGALEIFFRSRPQNVTFARSAEAAATINSFVEDATNGLIPKIVKSSSFTALTRMVLINAIYFKANWMHVFNKDNTAPMVFRVSSEASLKYPHGMRLTEDLNVADLETATAVELPYKNSNFRMLLFLPKSDVRETDVLSGINLGDLDSKMAMTRVKLTLPKFKAEYTVKLRGALEDMGVEDLFDPAAANLDDVSDDSELYVSDVIHKATVEVTEEGSEAAAATAVQVDSRAGGLLRPREISFNRPFVFVIQDKAHGIPLFVGRIVDPSGINLLVPRIINSPPQAEDLEERDSQTSLAEILGIPTPQQAAPVAAISEATTSSDCEELGFETNTQSNSAVVLPCKGKDTFPTRNQQDDLPVLDPP